MTLGGWDRQVDAKGHTLADLMYDAMTELVEVLVEIRDELKAIRRGREEA